MRILRITALALLLGLTACHGRPPVMTVVLIDTSLSITPRAEHAALAAVGDQIARLGRGDRLVVIPITGDAQNDAGGRILRLQAPTERQAYDNDLRRFRAEAKRQYVNWLASLDTHQRRTDILGALDLARQEFAAAPELKDRRLIVLSDFLEDEPSYRFVSATQLATAVRAKALARQLRAAKRFALPGVRVCLGRLESSDFAPLSPQRKAAVQTFWTEYLSVEGQVPELRFDGTGMLVGNAGCRDPMADNSETQPAKGATTP